MYIRMVFKRKYSSMSRGARAGGLSSKYKRGRNSVLPVRILGKNAAKYLSSRVSRIERTIEVKEGTFTLGNTNLPHNNVYVWNQSPFATSNGTGDPMAGIGNRIGDSITIRGLASTWFVEAALQRSKVYFRIMLMKGPRGASFSRADMFKGVSGNKMIDQLNTEKYTVISQKRFNVTPPNDVASSFTIVTGVPGTSNPGITGNKIVKFWIPGKKFGRGGVLQYENSSGTDLKFYDYRWVVLAYDWNGTPQDLNNVGIVNEAWSKIYFKDA